MRSSGISDQEPLGITGANLALAAEIGAALSAAPRMLDLIRILQRHLKWLLPATPVSLCLLDDDGARYRILAADSTDLSSEACYPLGDGLIAWVVDHRTALDVQDIKDEPRLTPEIASQLVRSTHGALLALPLEADNQIIGVLVLGSPRPGAYRLIDRGLVHLVALQVAAAVRTALLLAELDGAEAIVAGMARAVEARDPYTHGHSERVTAYALMLADAAAIPPHLRDVIAHAGPLHDVGKIGVPDAVLLKPDRLNDEELVLIQRHPEIGDTICQPLRALRRLRTVVRNHHERYDGRGYPDGLAGEAIPVEARVLALADAYDAMTSDRPYRQGMQVAKALAIIAQNEGPQWDPKLVPLFCSLKQLYRDVPVRHLIGITSRR